MPNDQEIAIGSWLIPTAGYVLVLGALAITSKLALRALEWPQLILLGAFGYAAAAARAVVAQNSSLELTTGAS